MDWLLRRFLLFLAASGSSWCLAASSELVGVIGTALEPSVAQELGLNDDQKNKLQELVAAQESKALDIAAEIRDLPVPERGPRLREIVQAFEQKAYAELNMQQRGRLERIRISKLGLATLTESEVAQAIDLSQGQSDQVRQILESRAELTRSLGEEGAKSEIEKRLRGVLTSGQWATWQAMAGQSARSAAVAAEAAAQPTAQSQPEASSPAPPTVAQNEGPTFRGDTRDQGQANDAPSARLADRSDDAVSRGRGLNDPSPLRVTGEKLLTLNFNGMPWEQVLQWISQEAELSLQADSYPIGTFTYRDPYRQYSVGEAIDIMNGVLLNKAYRLIRRQRSLMVLDLGTGESPEVVRGLLRELAELVPAEELDYRGDFELLKCLFVLTRLSPDDAQRQIGLLLGPEGSTIPLGSAGQILVTETAGKLRLVREMLRRAEDPDSSLGPKILTIPLKHVSAEEVLAIARPLLGLAEDTNQSEEIKMSTDTFGNMLFATGNADKLQLLKDAAAQVDVKPGEGAATAVTVEQPVLRVHPIQSSDADTAYNVLQTLLEGSPNVRMTLEPKTNSIVASATEADHKLINETLSTLAGESSSFTVIPLTRIDTQTALTTLEKFFGKPSGTSTGGSNNASAAVTGPIFLGDSLARTIMVKGSPQELTQVRELIGKLEETGPEADLLGGTMRVIPMTGKSADRLLDQVNYLWEARNKKNRIRIKIPSAANESRASAQEPPAAQEAPASPPPEKARPSTTNLSSIPRGRLVTTNSGEGESSADEDSSESGESEIVIYRGPTGLIVTCEDPKVLAEFEQIVRLVSEQMMTAASEPTVFYLKHVSAKSAEELLRSILAGDASGGSTGGGSLIGNVIGEMGGGLVGGLLGLGGGSTSTTSVSGGMASGEVTMTADPRLNSLMITANPIDLALVEELLSIIDREDSPERIATQGVPHIIPVVNNSAAEILEVVKVAFADKIGQAGSTGGQSRGGGGGQPDPQQFIEAIRGAVTGGRGGSGSRGSASELKPQTMLVGLHEKNNAIIVTGSQAMADMVREFVEQIDIASESTTEQIEVVQLPGVKTELFQTALTSVLGAKAKTNSTSSNSSSSSSNSSSGGSGNNEDAERRAEFLRQLQSRMGGGPGGGGPPGGGFPGGGFPGGFGGFRGGFPGGFGGGTRGGPPGGGGGGGGGGGDRR